MAAVTKPIRDLLKKDVQFNWSHEHKEAFKRLKHLISTSVLAFYNVKKPVTVSCDASQFGLGAVFLQEGQPVAYASLALTETECRYAQIEKDLLAVVFRLEKFNQYVYGKCVISHWKQSQKSPCVMPHLIYNVCYVDFRGMISRYVTSLGRK